MKRILNILAASVFAFGAGFAGVTGLICLTGLAGLSGCSRVEPPIFDESSAKRVQELIDAAYTTLTSAEDGWYMEYFPGYGQVGESGGFWFWCKFDKEYNVTAMSEIVTDESGKFKEETSKYELVRGLGAVLTFSDYSEVLDVFYNPGVGETQGRQGELQFVIEKVEADVVTLIGFRTKKKMYLRRKRSSTTVAADFAKTTNLVARMQDCPWYTVEIRAAMAADQIALHPTLAVEVSTTSNDRAMSITYSKIIPTVTRPIADSVEVIYDQNLLLCPSMSEDYFPLYEEVDVMGNKISGFVFEVKDGVGTLTSNDANQTVKFTQVQLPRRTLDDVLGSYTMKAYSSYEGYGSYDVSIARKSDGGPNDVVISVNISPEYNIVISTAGKLNAEGSAITCATPQDTGYIIGANTANPHKLVFQNGSKMNTDVYFWIAEPGKLRCNQSWGYHAPTYNNNAGAWSERFSNAILTRK